VLILRQGTDTYTVPLPEGDKWSDPHMTLPKTKTDDLSPPDPTDKVCPGYRNLNTPWWDGSQIYGSSESITLALRAKHPDGKLEMDARGTESFLPRDKDGNVETGFNNNWWIGMEILHTLFALEHNALCDMFRKAYPDWSG
jgi:hypothetical protein